ncbi:ATP-dependent metallopeptidase FtsH/Yme1/Tma family protein, partial [Candidatus Dependentiae bacterium]
MKKNGKTLQGRGPGPRYVILLIILTIFGITFAINYFSAPKFTEVPYSALISFVEKKQVDKAKVEGHVVFGVLKSGERFRANIIPSNNFITTLRDAGAEV